MVIASATRENISVFSIFENRENFSTQPKGLLFRNKRKMPRKTVKPATFVSIGEFLRRSLSYFVDCLPHQFIKLF